MAIDRNSLNKAMIIGHVGADPEMRHTNNNTPVTNLSVATNTTYQDQQGNRQDQTEWHRVSLFGRLAEVAQNYLKKGSMVYVEGRLQTRQYEDRDGNTRYSTEIIANSMTLLGNRSGGESGNQGGTQATSQEPAQQQPDASEPDDDLPF